MLHFDLKLFILLFMSMGFDWMVQTDWEASNKFTNDWARFIHAWTYSTLTFIFLSLFGYWSTSLLFIYFILIVTHYVIDKRTIVIWWMKNVKHIQDPKDSTKWWWMNIAIDQWLHLWVNLFLSVLVTYIKF